MTSAIRVLLAMSRGLLSAVLPRYLEGQDDLVVSGTAHDLESARLALADISPDVLVLESTLPASKRGSWDEPFPTTIPVVLLCGSCAEQEHLNETASTAGRVAVAQCQSPESLVEAIRRIHADPLAPAPPPDHTDCAAEIFRTAGGLTKTELAVLRLVCGGLSSKDVSSQLTIKVRTAENHRYRLMKKLGVKNLSELTRVAIRWGLAR